jgi:site-specific recombinase XerD
MDTVLVFGKHKIRLFQRDDQPSNYWFMRVHIEGKQFRRSLQTCVLEMAKEAATQHMIDILAKKKAGQRVFPTTIKQFRDAFLLDLQSQTARKRSLLTIKNTTHRIDRGVQFLKEDQKIESSAAVDSVDGQKWQGYISWRLKQNPELRRDTIYGELVSIKGAYDWARKKEWCAEWNLPAWELETENQQAMRDKMPAADFQRARKLIGEWVASAQDGMPRMRRSMVRVVFETIAAGGFRTGEMLKLRRKDVQVGDNEIIVTVQEETSKVRKFRQVPLLHSSAAHLRGWLEMRKDLQPDALVFALRKSKDASRMFYDQFTELRKDVLESQGLGDLDAYHGRHARITELLLTGHSIHLVAKLAGTSVAQIEKTYSGVIEVAIGREFAKHKLTYNEDGSFEVTKR